MTEQTQQNTSPSPKKNVNMTFFDALKEITQGKKITRLEWHNKEEYGILKDTFLMLHRADGKFYQWIINDGDLLGTDWVLV